MVGVGYGDALLAEAAVAVRDGAGVHAADVKGDDFAAEDGDDPAYGPDESGTVLDAPVHCLGEVNGEDNLGQNLSEDVFGRTTFDFALDEDLAVGADFDLIQADSRAFGEPFRGFGRLAFGVEGDVLGRPAKSLSFVGLAGSDAGSHEGETARRRFGRTGHARGQIEFFEGGEEALLEIRQRVGDHPVRDLFGADF